jgi:hypothetical protein
MVKEDEKTLKKRKSSPEPKVTTSKKRKTVTPEPRMAGTEEEAPSTPSAAKSSGAASDEAFTEKERSFGSEKGGWAEKAKNCYCYASY